MQKKILITLLLAINLLNQIKATKYEKILMPQTGEYSENKCLDGSPQSIYVKQDMEKVDEKKIVIFFNGGGWASTGNNDGRDGVLDKAYERSQTARGNSNKQPKVISKHGIFDSSKSKNPAFYDYNIIKIQMCDSNGYQGHVEKPIKHKGKKLWFRGKENTLAVLRYLKENYELESAETVIVSGSSAGAQSAAYWLDYIAFDLKKINPKINVLGVLGNGLFRLDWYNHDKKSLFFDTQMRQMADLINRESDPIQEACVKANPDQKYKCLSFQENYKYIETPLILVQSNIDSYWSILAGVDCLGNEDQEFMEECQKNQHQNTVMNYNSLGFNTLVTRMMNEKKNMSAFIIKERVHTFIGDNKYFNQESKNVSDNVYFFNNENDNEDFQVNYKGMTTATAIQKFVDLQLNQSEEEKQQNIPAKQIRLINREYDLHPTVKNRGLLFYIVIGTGILTVLLIVAIFMHKFKRSKVQNIIKLKKNINENNNNKIVTLEQQDQKIENQPKVNMQKQESASSAAAIDGQKTDNVLPASLGDIESQTHIQKK